MTKISAKKSQSFSQHLQQSSFFFVCKDAWNNLGEIIGETYTDELLDELFSRFCLGK